MPPVNVNSIARVRCFIARGVGVLMVFSAMSWLPTTTAANRRQVVNAA